MKITKTAKSRGNTLRMRRIKLGWSQRQLGEAVGLKPHSRGAMPIVSGWEQGKPIPAEMRAKLKEALDNGVPNDINLARLPNRKRSASKKRAATRGKARRATRPSFNGRLIPSRNITLDDALARLKSQRASLDLTIATLEKIPVR